MARRVEVAKSAVARVPAQLDSLSPLAVLERGYSLTTRATTASCIRAGDLAARRASAHAAGRRPIHSAGWKSIDSQPNETPVGRAEKSMRTR